MLGPVGSSWPRGSSCLVLQRSNHVAPKPAPLGSWDPWGALARARTRRPHPWAPRVARVRGATAPHSQIPGRFCTFKIKSPSGTPALKKGRGWRAASVSARPHAPAETRCLLLPGRGERPENGTGLEASLWSRAAGRRRGPLASGPRGAGVATAAGIGTAISRTDAPA